MTREKVVKSILSCIKNNDITIFLGAGLCKEIYKYDKDESFYITDNNCNGLMVALGIAMNTDKRVFVFCNDSDLLKNMSCMLNIAISKCKNIFVIILQSGKYQESGGQLNIFDSILAPKGILFNMGFLVLDYTVHLKNKTTLKILDNLIERNVGPTASIVKVTSSTINKGDDVIIESVLLKDRIKSFIKNTEIGSALYKG